MQTRLYIQAHKKEEGPETIHYENLGYFYDTKTKIGVQKKLIDCDLSPGMVYDFTFDYGDDEDTYCFVVLKRDENIYYLAEYYDGFYKPAEEHLGEWWERCDVLETFDIDLELWEDVKIQTNGLPDMRAKIEEYIEELNQEIARCNKTEEAAKEIHGGYQGRISTLIDVVNDLQGMLNELI